MLAILDGTIVQQPITTFVILLVIVLAAPPLFERFKLPGLVGLLVAGILFGNHGLGWLSPESDTLKLFSSIGKIYLMFVAGLEIDLEQFRQTRTRSMTFGALTFAIPMLGGIALGLFFQLGWLAAVLVGSLLASHTLLAYPLIQRHGVVGNEAIVVTVGATIFTDIGALLVLAICLGINQGDFTALKLLWMLAALLFYTLGVLVGLKRFGLLFFRRTGQDEGNQFLFVLLAVFLCAVVAQMIGVEDIIGAFLAGLAINSVIGDGPVKEKVEFMGTVLFIPMFFVNMGLLLDLNAFSSLFQSIELPLLLVLTLLATKLLAAWVTSWRFGYSRSQFWAMWSLSIPQVAATLAAALVGYEAGIINIQMFNSVVLMMLVTSVLGPLVTARFAPKLAVVQAEASGVTFDWLPLPSPEPERFSVLVPVYNPRTEASLIELAAMLASYEGGQVLPLAIAVALPRMTRQQIERSMLHCRRRLQAATKINTPFNPPIKPRLRVDADVSQAILNVSLEEQVQVIVLGIGARSPLESRLLPSIPEEIIQRSNCLVTVARLLTSPMTCKHILLPVNIPSPLLLRVLRFAQVMTQVNQGEVTLLHVCSPRTSLEQRQQLTQKFEAIIALLPEVGNFRIVIQSGDSPAHMIARLAPEYDLVLLRSQMSGVGPGWTGGSNTISLLKRISGSLILFSEPRSAQSRLGTASSSALISA